MLEKIAIIGAGGFGREVEMLINQINYYKKQYNFIGFYDDYLSGENINGTIDDLKFYNSKLTICIAIADPILKNQIVDKLKLNNHLNYATLIHPNVIIGTSLDTIGNGCIICAGNIITVNTKIGNYVTLNLSCTVGHDTIIEDYCSFMPSVNISGEVHIESKVYVGTGSKIINKIKIGENTTIGAGSLVTKSIQSNCVALGVPAKIIKLK